MKVYGIVCECNPFHAGHRYLLDKACELGADAVVAVMSGDFVQRGEPAFLSKFDRARDLADNGCDLVIELPVRYCLSSAERFADAGIGILEATGTVDTVLFGSECGDLETLKKAAELTDDADILDRIDGLCETGMTWPAARSLAVEEAGYPDIAGILDGSNNILAAEYIKALNRRHSTMTPRTVRRGEVKTTAHGVRDTAANGGDVSGMVTAYALGQIRAGETPVPGYWDRIALAALRKLSSEDFSMLEDVTGGLDSRLYAASRTAASLDEFYGAVKTKRYTMSRVKRATVRAILGLTGRDPVVPYMRILAIGRNGAQVLSEMKDRAELPFSESLRKLAQTGGDCSRTAREEITATDLYAILKETPSPAFEDYTRKLYAVK